LTPLSLQKVAIMTSFLGYVVSSQQFWNEKGQNRIILIRGQNHNILKFKGRKMQFSQIFLVFQCTPITFKLKLVYYVSVQ